LTLAHGAQLSWGMSDNLLQALSIQSKACALLGSPFHAALLSEAVADLQSGGLVTELLAPWEAAGAKEIMAAAVPLRLLGALHDLVLSGEDPALTAAYPQLGRTVDPAAAWREAVRAITERRAQLAGFMEHEPQTNEVRRSACLLGGFLTIAQETGLPLRCFEIGASAGLNLSWDRYHYSLGDAVWGPESSVLLPTDWSGPLPPLNAKIEVVQRAACDRRPVDLTDLVQRRRLLAYVWPDQFERLERLRAAVDLALAQKVEVEAADAVTWTARMAGPAPGATTVIYHSVFWQYMPADSQAALRKTIEYLGVSATAEAPLAWLRMEPPPENAAGMELRLTLWPGGEERVLADVHPHGAAVRWRSPG
jgi:hypothetical protein